MILLALLLLPGCVATSGDPEAVELRRIILVQVSRHPRMEPRDLYKLLHQAAMGSEHAIEDTIGVRVWLQRELSTMGQGPIEPMLDTIAPGGRVVRIHLRAWVAAGRPTDHILAAFLRTGGLVPRDTGRLGRYLAVTDTLARQGRLPFQRQLWRDEVDGARGGGYPAVHHSDAFVSAYRPAYRVVAGSLVP